MATCGRANERIPTLRALKVRCGAGGGSLFRPDVDVGDVGGGFPGAESEKQVMQKN